MIKINPKTQCVRDDGTVYLQATCDSTNDLKASGSSASYDLKTIDGLDISFGSLALVGTAGDFYYFNGSTWSKVGS